MGFGIDLRARRSKSARDFELERPEQDGLVLIGGGGVIKTRQIIVAFD
jgi:hypothetical protein